MAPRLVTGPSLGKPPAVLLGGRDGRGATSLIVRGGPKIVPVTITIIVPRLGLCVGALIGGHRGLLLGNLYRVQRCSELGRKGVRFVLLLN